jgi:hypothetical protein
MQLPRGTFREIKKGVTIEDLLSEFERSRFSGVCSISSEAGSGTLVYKNGKCILVKFLGKSGDAGCTELQKNRNHEVDAALSSLDEAQIQLSLEFNKTCRPVKVVKPLEEPKKAAQPAQEPVKKPAPPVNTTTHVPAAKTPPSKPPAASLFHRPAPPVQPPTAPEPKTQRAVQSLPRPAMPAPPAAQRPPAPTAKAPDQALDEDKTDALSQSSSFDNDIDTFDTMDLDNVTDKIRNDCKTMIKQLHLEHLMER